MRKHFGRKLRLEFTDEAGDGIDLGDLSAEFEIERLAGSELNTAHLTIFNLLPSTIARISEKLKRIRIVAGYVDSSGVIFCGNVRNVFTTYEGPTRITEIFAADGARDYETSFVNLTLGSGLPLREVVKTIARHFTEIVVPQSILADDTTVVGAQHFSMMTREALSELAESHGFSWSIQNETLEIVRDDEVNDRSAIEISRETGMVGSPTSRLDGITVKSLLNSAIIPNRIVNIVTAGSVVQAEIGDVVTPGLRERLVGALGGKFRVLRVSHVGATRGQEWYSTVVGLPPKQVRSRR